MIKIEVLDKPQHKSGTSKRTGNPYEMYIVPCALVRDRNGREILKEFERRFFRAEDVPAPGFYTLDPDSIDVVVQNGEPELAIKRDFGMVPARPVAAKAA